MNPTLRALAWYFTALLAVLLLCLALGPFIVFNDTASEPIGLYWRTSQTPGVGDFVEVAAKDLPISYPWLPRYLLKQIAVFGPAQIKVDDAGVTINGHWAGPRPRNSHIAPYFFDGTIPAGSAWLAAPPAASLDSRHFGAIAVSKLSTKIVPLWTF